MGPFQLRLFYDSSGLEDDLKDILLDMEEF